MYYLSLKEAYRLDSPAQQGLDYSPRVPEIPSVIGWAKLPEQGDLSTQTAKEQTDVDKCSTLGTTVLSWSL